MTRRGIANLAVTFSACVRKSGGQCVVIGSTSVAAWGRPRATSDVDVLLQLDPSNFHRFVRALKKAELTPREADLRAGYEGRGHVAVFDPTGSFYVDVKFAKTDEERQEVNAGKTVRLDEGSFRIAPLEETIAYKLSSGSPKDIDDVRGIIIVSGDRIDQERLHPLLVDLGVADLYKRLLKEAREEDSDG